MAASSRVPVVMLPPPTPVSADIIAEAQRAAMATVVIDSKEEKCTSTFPSASIVATAAQATGTRMAMAATIETTPITAAMPVTATTATTTVATESIEAKYQWIFRILSEAHYDTSCFSSDAMAIDERVSLRLETCIDYIRQSVSLSYIKNLAGEKTSNGVNVRFFLELTIANYFHMLYALVAGKETLPFSDEYTLFLKKDNDARESAISSIAEEILLTRESLRLFSLLYYHSVYPSLLIKDVTTLSCQIAHDMKSSQEKIIPFRGENDKSFHVIYIRLIRNEKHVHIVIYNAGAKYNERYPKKHPYFPDKLYHAPNPEKENHIYPRHITTINLLDETEYKIFEDYIKELFIHFDKELKLALPKIYHHAGALPPPQHISFNSYLKQSVGNCGTYGWEIGMRERLPSILYPWIHNTLISLTKTLRYVEQPPLRLLEKDSDPFDILQLMLRKNLPTEYRSLESMPKDLFDVLIKKGSPNVTVIENELFSYYKIRKLTKINLSHINLHDSSVIALMKVLVCFPHFRKIDLSRNFLTDKGVEILRQYILDGFLSNLQIVHLADNPCSALMKKKIRYALHRNSKPVSTFFARSTEDALEPEANINPHKRYKTR